MRMLNLDCVERCPNAMRPDLLERIRIVHRRFHRRSQQLVIVGDIFLEASAWDDAAEYFPATRIASPTNRFSSSSASSSFASGSVGRSSQASVRAAVADSSRSETSAIVAPPKRPACGHPNFASDRRLVSRARKVLTRDRRHRRNVPPRTDRLPNAHRSAMQACPRQKIVRPDSST